MKPDPVGVLDFSERPRDGDWSMRAALCRYAQPEPARVGNLLEVVRRVEFALAPHAKSIDGADPGLLEVASELDKLGDVLAGWAVDGKASRPNDEIDAAVSSLARRLDELGVAREERPTRAR